MSSDFSGEELFFDLALQDLIRGADLFGPVHGRTTGNEGLVSLEVLPPLACGTKGSAAAAISLHQKAIRPKLFIKFPGEEGREFRNRRNNRRWRGHQRDAFFLEITTWRQRTHKCEG